IWNRRLEDYRHFVARAAPLLDESGQAREWVGHIVDVHDSKVAELELHRRDEQIRAILDHSPAFIFVKDPSGRYLLAGRQCETVLGVAADAIIGKTDYDVLPVAVADQRRSNERRVIASGGQTLEVEEILTEPAGGGQPRTFLTSVYPLTDALGTVYAVAGISTD